ncbi:MAG: iron-sulfur cluster assembly protein [Verrucomicrobiota bacterium]
METELLRETNVTAIPAGTESVLAAGTPVYVTQTLGGNVTVRVDSGLFRIAKEDADAVKDLSLEESDSAHEGEFSEEMVWEAMKRCFDPEIPVNIVDLGLVYDMRVEELDTGKKAIFVKMTLTAQGCGMGPVIADDAKANILQIEEVESAEVEIVWDPVWNPQMISPAGRSILGIE